MFLSECFELQENFLNVFHNHKFIDFVLSKGYVINDLVLFYSGNYLSDLEFPKLGTAECAIEVFISVNNKTTVRKQCVKCDLKLIEHCIRLLCLSSAISVTY